MYPEELKYTAEHEWVRVVDEGSDGGEVAGTVVRVGITDFAQDALGDIVFVTVPEPGSTVQAGVPCGEVESTKSVSDVFAPVSGTVTASNDALDASPELVNSDAYGDGWLFEVRCDDPSAVGGLLDRDDYLSQLEQA